MPVTTDNIRKWIEQSDIDYISQYIKSWIPFNAWYNANYPGLKTDREKINAIKKESNAVRNKINTLLESESQEGLEFKSYLASLHHELQENHIENTYGERIWFDDIVRSKNFTSEITEIDRGITYYLKRTDKGPLGEIEKIEIYLKGRDGDTFFRYSHSEYDITHLLSQSIYDSLSLNQQENLRVYFGQLEPVLITSAIETNLKHSPMNHYVCDSYHFKRDNNDSYCKGHIVCKALTETLYQLRNVLFHGNIAPSKPHQKVYKNAFFCLKYLLNSID